MGLELYPYASLRGVMSQAFHSLNKITVSLGTDISQWSALVFFHPFQWLVYFNSCIMMIRLHLPCKCAVSSRVKYFNLKLHKTIYLQLSDLQKLYSVIFHLYLEVINLDMFLLSPRPHSLGHTKASVQLVPAAEQGGV
jgi:hypothetical protein